MKNFVNYHVLISHSPSCLNRDDMNMQKSAIFGGVRRVRISSQSLKRAMRKSEYYHRHLGEPSTRSRNLDLLKDEFLDQLKGEFAEEIIFEALERFSKTKAGNGGVEGHAEGETEKTPGKKLAVAPWVKEEFKIICQIVQETHEESSTIQKKAEHAFNKQTGKKKKPLEHFVGIALEKRIDKKLEDHRKALKQALSTATDVALSGRMATSGLMTSVDGALAVAHALTTHSVDSDIDWFTAVDDLQEQGSGHLDTQEFSSGVFYRYGSLNLKQLQVNLGLIPDMTSAETTETRNCALEIAAHVLQMLATVVPSAKQQSFAAHNLADLALVSFSDIPVSLANAFEQPVHQKNGSGYRGPSIAALHDYWQKVHTGYALDERCGQFSLSDSAVPDGIVAKPSLEALKAWVCNNGEG